MLKLMKSCNCESFTADLHICLRLSLAFLLDSLIYALALGVYDDDSVIM